MKFVAPLAAFALSACATTGAGIGQKPIDFAMQSRNSAQVTMNCWSDAIQGPSFVRGSGGHWWVVRNNGLGLPIVRWDAYDLPQGGSRLEVRAEGITGVARDRMEICAR